MKELMEHIAKSLVENPDAVVVEENETAGEISLRLSVAPGDMGKVIGKQGRIARAIRSLLRAAAAKDGKKCNLEIE